jgi:glycosyltransferase involved in cell wall biosynthesis/peptidoglycan/xylan/chitin deacetylase (PgdA/CDA1 family)
MLRRLARSAIAHGLSRSGADRALGRISGLEKEPLILGYHRVLPAGHSEASRGVPSLGIQMTTLERHIDFIARRFRFVPLDEMGRRIEDGTAANLAALTFDDGYVDFYENAFPLLQRKGIPAAVFVVTGLVEGASGFLHDRVHATLQRALGAWAASRLDAFLDPLGLRIEALPAEAFAATRILLRRLDQESLVRVCDRLDHELGPPEQAPRSLTWDELGRMSRAGVTVGSHTRTHTLLTRETPARVIEETLTSKLEIEARLGVPVQHFVYPDGDFDIAAVKAVAAAGYRYAYTGCTHRDFAHPLLTLPRRVFWEGSTLGALGGFSADVLSSQINGVFDRATSCLHHHGMGSRDGKAKTIAIVGPSLDIVGGQSVQAAALVRGLQQQHGVIFVPTNPRFPKGLGWLRRVPIARTVLNQVLYILSLRRLGRADVVHVFSASFWSFLLAPVPAMLIARLFRKRVVLNYHSGEAAEHLRKWGLLVHPFIRLAHGIVVPSDYLREEFARHGYEARVVRNVIDTSRFGYRLRSPLSPRLLSTRNLEPGYRVDLVLSAFALIKTERPDATLTVAGGGSEAARLRAMSEGMSGVTFLGPVAPADMPDVCSAADVFLNASVVDNQPLSLLEAFASGLPVVTTASGGIAAMVRQGESGIIVPPLDPAAMAAAVIALLLDDERAGRIARGARAVAEAHSWPLVSDLWDAVYCGTLLVARAVDA